MASSRAMRLPDRSGGYGVGSVADEDGAASAPARKAGNVVDGDVEDIGGGLDEVGDGIGPVAVEGEETLLEVGFGGGGHLCRVLFEWCGGSAPP